MAGEQHGMTNNGTVMYFNIQRNAIGAALFREPTLLFQPNKPAGSSLYSNILGSPNSHALGAIAPDTWSGSAPFFGNSGFASAVTGDDGTSPPLPVSGNGYIGFYVGSIPMQWADMNSEKDGNDNPIPPYRCPSLQMASNGTYGINYYLQYFDNVLNQYVTYDQKQGNYNWHNGLMANQAAGFITPGGLFGHRMEVIDPRTSRFNFIDSFGGAGRLFPPPFPAGVANSSTESGWLNQSEGILSSARNGTSYGTGLAFVESPFASSALGWYPGNWKNYDAPTVFRPGAYAQNNPDVTSVDQNASDQTGSDNGMPSGADVAQYYADPDGVVRRSMAGYSNVATHTAAGPSTAPSTTPLYGFPMSTANTEPTPPTSPVRSIQSDSRPVILNRPFRSVSEMGYAFSGTPWKNVDFFTPESGFSALLDVFCIQDTDSSTALVAGKVDLNTRQVPVLQSIIAGAYKDEWNSASATVAGGASSLAQKIAQQLVTRTTDVTTKSGGILVNGPLQNLGELVGKWVAQQNLSGGGIDGSKSYSGFSGDLNSVLTSASDDYNVQRFREAAMRALSASGQTRVWNLMIDLVAQTGRYPQTASSVQSFNVEGEQRYWVHIAIDRLTGQVLDKQVEIIKE